MKKDKPLRLHAVADIGEALDVGEEDRQILAGQCAGGSLLAEKIEL